MSYRDTFILVAPDCPVEHSVIPSSGKSEPTVPMLQYELLTSSPYRYDHEDLIFEVHIKRNKLTVQLDEVWHQLFQKSHPCMRASMLPKKYGWGVHYDSNGKIAIYPMESAEYEKFMEDDKIKKYFAMRSKKAAE